MGRLFAIVMDIDARPLEILLLQLSLRVRRICEGLDIKDPELADETISTYLNISKAIRRGDEYFGYGGRKYFLPKDEPSDEILAMIIRYSQRNERKDLMREKKSGKVKIRDVVYEVERLSEQQKLEAEIEHYIVQDTMVCTHKLNIGNDREMRNHLSGNIEEDIRFAQDYGCSKPSVESFTGRKRLELILKLNREDPNIFGGRTVNDLEIKDKWQRLNQIYFIKQISDEFE